MSWNPKSVMDVKREFLELAMREGANRRELCRRFGISPKTAYALIKRYQEEGWAACQARSSRPLSSPDKTSSATESLIVELRGQHPAWGGRKIERRLIDQGHSDVPRPSTITGILHRHGLVDQAASVAAQHWHRFEHEAPNDLWQMDFKGNFATTEGLCHPLTLLDDHSRFNLAITACSNTRTPTIQDELQRIFERYGLPRRINADNGPPWGSPAAGGGGLSDLTIWLVRLGVSVSHSAPHHPQTNGKLERFHKSLKAEVLKGRHYDGIQEAQVAFDRWRVTYNTVRPHEAIGMALPISRYVISQRSFPSRLAPIEYAPDDTVITVGWCGRVKFKGVKIIVPSSLHRQPIAFREDPEEDGCYNLYFCHQRFMRVNLAAR
jgi:transposase InsO family protein